jgi:hypothetical protein
VSFVASVCEKAECHGDDAREAGDQETTCGVRVGRLAYNITSPGKGSWLKRSEGELELIDGVIKRRISSASTWLARACKHCSCD